jgi:hypothetical protein
MQYVVFAPPESRLPALLPGHTVERVSAVTRESLALMLEADAVAIDASLGSDASYVLGLLHGLHRRAVLVDDGMTVESLAAAIREARAPFADMTRRSGSPLEGVIDLASMDTAVRDHLERRGIIAAADLAQLNLDDLAADVSRPALQRFVRELARSGRHPQPDALKEFLVRRGMFI